MVLCVSKAIPSSSLTAPRMWIFANDGRYLGHYVWKKIYGLFHKLVTKELDSLF